jgi:hypothetical protein
MDPLVELNLVTTTHSRGATYLFEKIRLMKTAVSFSCVNEANSVM